MSVQGSKGIIKGKVVKGTGSILSNLDAKARKAFARRANRAVQHDIEHEKEEAFKHELDEIHQQQAKRKKAKAQVNRHERSLLYWLISASFSDIWHHLFSSSRK